MSESGSARWFIIDSLRAQSPQSAGGLAKQYGCSINTIRAAIRRMLERGEVERVRHGSYRLGEAGEPRKAPEFIVTPAARQAAMRALARGVAAQEPAGAVIDAVIAALKNATILQ